MNSPFNQEQAELLNRLLPTLTESQKVWLSGYLAATQVASPQYPICSCFRNTRPPVGEHPAQSSGQIISKEVTILYGSQTGNAQGLAEKAGKTLEGHGFQVTVSSMSDFKPNNLKNIQNLLNCTSTHGEGNHRIMRLRSMNFFMENGLQSLMIYVFLFCRLEIVRMSFSVRQEKILISA